LCAGAHRHDLDSVALIFESVIKMFDSIAMIFDFVIMTFEPSIKIFDSVVMTFEFTIVFCWRLVDVGASSSSSLSPATAPKKLIDGAVMVCVINEVNDQPVGNPKSKCDEYSSKFFPQ
jgi:hypothetical protein